MITPDVDEEWIAQIRAQPTRKEIRAFLQECGSDRNFEYVLNIVTLAESVDRMDDTLESIIVDEKLSTTIRFNAFYTLAFCHYKTKNISDLESIHKKYGSEFEDVSFYYYLRAVLLRERKKSGDLHRAIREIDQALKDFPNNPGILKAAANMYLTALENDAIVNNRDEMTDRAEEYITRAINIYPNYAEYYVDLGRVRINQKLFDKAEAAIYRAIDIESKDKENYALQIAEYQHYLARIQVKKLDHQYEKEVRSVREGLNELEQRSQEILREFQMVVIQTLSFFGGLIALIVTFVQVSLTLPLTQAAQLVMIIMGSIIIAFGGLSVVLPSEISIKRIAVIYITGILLIGSGALPIFVL